MTTRSFDSEDFHDCQELPDDQDDDSVDHGPPKRQQRQIYTVPISAQPSPLQHFTFEEPAVKGADDDLVGCRVKRDLEGFRFLNQSYSLGRLLRVLVVLLQCSGLQQGSHEAAKRPSRRRGQEQKVYYTENDSYII